MNNVYPFTDKDLAQLPAPTVIKNIGFSALLAQRKLELNAQQPLLFVGDSPVYKAATLVNTGTETYWKIPYDSEAGLYYLDLPSDPATRILEADTYRELLLQQRINEAAVSGMIAYANGADLDQLAANYGISRFTIVPANGDVAAAAVMESDEALRTRCLLAIEGYARGGSLGWYLFNVLSASPLIKDAVVSSPSPCHISITLLSHVGNGIADQTLIDTVYDYVSSRYNRVLGDIISVQSAEVIPYALTAGVQLYQGPAKSVVFAAIEAAFARFRQQSERIGHGIYASAVDAALQQAGVYKVNITNPALPLATAANQAAYCTQLNLVEVFGND